MTSINVLIVGVVPRSGKNMGRLLEDVPTDYASKFSTPHFGGWHDITLSEELTDEARRIGTPVAVFDLDIMKVVTIVHADTCREEILRLPPSADER
jgi:hypothetical protein